MSNEIQIKKGEKVLVSPELTKAPDWIPGTIVEIEQNPFRGTVITVETKLGEFFDTLTSFKPCFKTA